MPAITPIEGSYGFRLKSLSAQVEGQVTVTFQLLVTQAGVTRSINERSYALGQDDAATIMSKPGVEGVPLIDQLTEAFSEKLKTRTDWLA